MKNSRYFSEREFNKCSPSCSREDMDQSFLNIMDKIRELVDRPLTITSAYRSTEYDKSKGRSGNSAHTKGVGVDFKAVDSAVRYAIIEAAISLGVNRIGVGETFVHVDIDKSLPQNVIWTYYK